MERILVSAAFRYFRSMGLTNFIENSFRKYLPSPFSIAVLLTLLTIILALVFTENTSDRYPIITILAYWEDGIWNNALLVFGYQMMLILVLGHVLVLSSPIESLILHLVKGIKNSANAAVLVALTTMLVAFFNWGLGLIFGALLARKVGEYAQEHNIPLNYPLIGACGYLGLMVWHGGISGSAPLKVSESGHLRSLMQGVLPPGRLEALPDSISTGETVLGGPNLIIFAMVLIVVSLVAYRLGQRAKATSIRLPKYRFTKQKSGVETVTERSEQSGSSAAKASNTLVTAEPPKGAERLDRSKWFAIAFGMLILAAFVVQYIPSLRSMNITPNMLNFFMFGIALILHGSVRSFLRAVEASIGDTAGILIQFPLYFGIMGIMAQSGMINAISDFFISVSNETTLPIFLFFSAGLVNVFVPSGGGQWAVQGPLVIESAMELGVPLGKAVLALAYGDQITNMLQPFWALPLLGITKLKARDILPYTLIFMVMAAFVYILGLLVF